jgi:hypothetical protein
VLITLFAGLGLTVSEPVVAAPPADDPPPGLFVDAGDVQPGDTETMGRSRLVKIDLTQFGGDGTDGSEEGWLIPSSTLHLNLFEDADFTATLERVETNPSGGFIWIDRLPGVELSQVFFLVKDGLVVGDIRMPGTAYGVEWAGEGLHRIRQETGQPRGESIDYVDRSHPSRPLATPIGTLMDDGSIIDIMVVYTPQARQEAGGVAAIEAKIDASVALSNVVLQNSNITPRLRLVHKAEISYTESGNITTDLSRLSNSGDGYLDNAHTLRDTYMADVVALITKTSGNYMCGYAGLAPGAFSITELRCAAPQLGFTHEVGYTLGANHDWYVDDSPGFLPLVIKSPGSASVSCTPVTPPESNNAVDAATLCSDQTAYGYIDRATDLDDVYKIWVNAGQRISITMSGTGGDADLFLYPPGTTDVNINPIAVSSTNDGNNEAIYAPISVSGFWYIDIYAYTDATNYTVKVTITS